ncbi:ArsR/SmtB family transcription factor [Streptomyces uncialis]|uniref:ArsR/SmtB family transcription factor n=1 Tax=Streptomyces uncialis TaxID=1048205 RepID=UPI0037B163D1
MTTEETRRDGTRRVLDPERDAAALKALTHPLRIRLLGLLRQHGPATASELAARTGESSASTSYHLRVLAKYAFVAEAVHRDGRERRWRAEHLVTSWSNEAMGASSEGRAAVAAMRRRQVEHLAASLDQHEADVEAGRLGQEWREPSGITDLLPRLTPESAVELQRVYEERLAELTAQDAEDPRALQVVVLTATLPLAPEAAGTGPTEDTTGPLGDTTRDAGSTVDAKDTGPAESTEPAPGAGSAPDAGEAEDGPGSGSTR